MDLSTVKYNSGSQAEPRTDVVDAVEALLGTSSMRIGGGFVGGTNEAPQLDAEELRKLNALLKAL